jgi:hypothetical protein
MKNENDNNDGDGNDSAVLSISMNGVSVEAVSAASKKKHKKRKAAKGQLKKLWRRATGAPPGIISRCEWNSLVDLHSDYKISSSHADESRISIGSNSPQGKRCGGGVATDHEAMMGSLPGPTICLATENRYDFGKLENWQSTEGCDHRDVLVNLLFGRVGLHNNSTPAKANKKRKVCPISTKDDGNLGVASRVHVPPLPSWSTICNQASLGGVAIIEVEIVGGDITATSCPLLPSQRIANSMTANCENVWSSLIHREINGNRESVEHQNNKVKRTISAACRVNLFQEKNEPRSISDVLMFLPPPPPPDQSDELKTSSGDFDMFRAMSNLRLKPKQLRSEGFPTLSNTNGTDTTVDAALERKLAMKTVCEIAKSSLDTKHDALHLVRTLSVNVISNDMDATTIDDEFSAMEYYVKSFSHRCAFDENSDSTSCSENDFQVHQRRLFALDCEMVKTSSEEPELARVSMIMFTGYDEDTERSTVVLDELVKPRRTVLDHLTREYLSVYPQKCMASTDDIDDT